MTRCRRSISSWYPWDRTARGCATKPSSRRRAAIIRFPDLAAAGRRLAAELQTYSGASDVVVLALVRGGVPAGVEVARALQLPLDVLLLRRLLLDASGAAVCGVWAAGTLVLDDGARADARTPPELACFLDGALVEFARRNALCRGGAPPRDLTGRVILLVDNGAHSGGTLRAAVRSLRALRTGRVVVAVPAADPAGHAAVTAVADEVVCLSATSPFGHVGMCYTQFHVPAIERVRELVAAV